VNYKIRLNTAKQVSATLFLRNHLRQK